MLQLKRNIKINQINYGEYKINNVQDAWKIHCKQKGKRILENEQKCSKVWFYT